MKIEFLVHDGTHVARGDNLLRISGSARAILSAERVALNFVQRLSGIATLTAQFVDAIKGTRAQILDTRKTTPGWRRFEKYAVACGGGKNHRLGLFDMVLIKDNHLAALRNEKPNAIAAAIQLARKQFPKLKIEVEADTLEQVAQAVDAGADIVLLDNMTLRAIAAGGENRQGPRENRGQRRREFGNRSARLPKPAWILFPSARSRIPRARWTLAWILKNDHRTPKFFPRCAKMPTAFPAHNSRSN